MLTKYDIVAIRETWCEKETENEILRDKLDGFSCYTEKATRTNRHGRASGGICVYVRSVMDKFVTRIDAGLRFAVILELSNLFNTTLGEFSENVILICAYLPPKNSSAYDDELDGILILREKLIDLKIGYPNHRLFVLGDLNARIGNMQDFLAHDDVQFIPGMDWYVPENFDMPKTAKDSVTNDFGNSLIDLCINFLAFKARHAQSKSDIFENILVWEKGIILKHETKTALMRQNTSQIKPIPSDRTHIELL